MQYPSSLTLSVRAAVGFVLIAVCSGCVTAEGVRFSKKSLCVYSELGYDTPLAASETEVARDIIVVGRVTSFRSFEKRDADDRYREYTTCAAEVGPRASMESFTRQIAGWTGVEFENYAFARLSLWALVPTELDGKIIHTYAFTSHLYGRAKDLVAARANGDGILVVTEVLCGMGGGRDVFMGCASRFETGMFDGATGEQLTIKGLPKKNGIRIDPDTYRPVFFAPRSR